MADCKYWRKGRGQKHCIHFLGYKVLELDERITGKAKYEIKESCKCRCALKGSETDAKS